jgi:hypothetical protein
MSRTKENEASFSEGSKEFGKITLRPFTVGTLSLCRQLKLSMFTGEGDGSGLDQQRQIMVFAWAQSAPLAQVLQAVRSGKWTEAVEEFEFGVVPAQITELVEEINRISTAIKAAAVDVEEKPNSGDEDAPPN